MGRCGYGVIRSRPVSRFRTRIGARVAPQQSPVLRPGISIIASFGLFFTFTSSTLSCLFELTITLVKDFLFTPEPFVVGRDIAQSAMQTHVVVVVDETLNDSSGVVYRQR